MTIVRVTLGAAGLVDAADVRSTRTAGTGGFGVRGSNTFGVST
jgi:hypothetical protein